MVIDRCCWKPWWMPSDFTGPATVLPTGSMLDKPLDAVAWTGSIRFTVKPSKISTSIPWYATSASSYAVIPRGKQIPLEEDLSSRPVDPGRMPSLKIDAGMVGKRDQRKDG